MLLCFTVSRVPCFKVWFSCGSSQDDVSLLGWPGALHLQISQDLTPFTGFICLLLPEDKKLRSLPVIIKEQLFIGSQQRLEAGPGRPCMALLFLAFGKKNVSLLALWCFISKTFFSLLLLLLLTSQLLLRCRVLSRWVSHLATHWN